MAKNIDRYTYRVTWSEEDQEHVGNCSLRSSHYPAFPERFFRKMCVQIRVADPSAALIVFC